MANVYDATKEHQKLDRSSQGIATNRHPNKKRGGKHPVSGNYSKKH